MNYSEIQTEVQNLVSDPSSRILDKIPDFINEALQEAAGRVLLPSLKRLGTVNTVPSQAWVTLPSGSSGKITEVNPADSNADRIEIVDGGLEELLKLEGVGDPDANEGSVTKVAVEGTLLWYQAVPASAQSLFLVHYINPTNLSAPADIPSDIPTYLHRRVLVHGAAKIAFEEIEQDVEDVKTELDASTIKFEEGIADLQRWVDARKRHIGKYGNYWSC